MATWYVNSGSISDLVVSNKIDATGSLFGTASYVNTADFANAINFTISDSVASSNVSQLVFSNSNNVNFGLNGSTITATADVGFSYSYYNPKNAYLQAIGTWGDASLFMQPFQAQQNFQFDRIAIPIYVSYATSLTTNAGSTMGLSLSLSLGFYTRNGSTLNLLTDASKGTNIAVSIGSTGAAGNNDTVYNGIRLLTMGLTNTLTEGQYYFAVLSSASVTRGSISNLVASQQASSFSGIFAQAYNLSIQYTRGLGFYSTTTNALPAAIQMSQLYGAATYTTANASATQVLRQPIFYVVSQTF